MENNIIHYENNWGQSIEADIPESVVEELKKLGLESFIIEALEEAYNEGWRDAY